MEIRDLLHFGGGHAEGRAAQRQDQANAIAGPIQWREGQGTLVRDLERRERHPGKQRVQQEIDEDNGHSVSYSTVHAGKFGDQHTGDPTVEDHRCEADIDHVVGAPTNTDTTATYALRSLLLQGCRVADLGPIHQKLAGREVAAIRRRMRGAHRQRLASPIVWPSARDPISHIGSPVAGHRPQPTHHRQERDREQHATEVEAHFLQDERVGIALQQLLHQQ
mmetsp:Transcript_21741/g.62474  ORF Transcript_21741/g.62474 Transcript_21741/m.62474 type:complete len:221 (-) Transcript_21741:554-1216(-)